MLTLRNCTNLVGVYAYMTRQGRRSAETREFLTFPCFFLLCRILENIVGNMSGSQRYITLIFTTILQFVLSHDLQQTKQTTTHRIKK